MLTPIRPSNAGKRMWCGSVVVCAALAALLPIAYGVFVLTNSSWHRKKILRQWSENVEASDRYVDAGVILQAVEADPNGAELVEGKPRLRVIAAKCRRFGGIIDTKSVPARIVHESCAPVTWYCSEAQWEILIHSDQTVMGQLVYGSEGAGKTRVLAMWHYLKWIESIGQNREGGQTAPTTKRLEMILIEMLAIYPPAWYGGRYRKSDERFVMCDGTRIQLVSTYRQSASQGSPVQGFNWSWCGRDEGQDQVDVHEDIVSRGRSARGGGLYYHQLITATAKDDSDWRTLRDMLLASGSWIKRGLSIYQSPFVAREAIDRNVATMDKREALRRYGHPDGTIDDLPAELAVFYGWDRKRNLTHRPQLATDVTAAVLSQYRSYMQPGARFSVVCGHDPGVIYNTTQVAKLIMFGDVPTWLVVGEYRTEQTTARDHALGLKKYLQDNFRVEVGREKAAIFVDPHGKGEAQTDYQTVYMAMQGVGLDPFNPAPMTQRIKRSARIEVINRLLCPAVGDIRLAVAMTAHGTPVAPHLVKAFETMRKRPGETDPEGVNRKDSADQTHYPAALGYLLWPFEQEALTASTVKTALAEARRVQ